MADPVLIDLPRQTVAIIRVTIPMESIRDFYDRAFEEVAEILASQWVAPTGPALGIYWGVPTDTVDLACGFPTARPISAEGRVVPEYLPAGRAAQVVHEGSYEGLGETYQRLAEWITGQGLTPGPMMWESYETEPTPDTDPASMRTRITWPLARTSAPHRPST